MGRPRLDDAKRVHIPLKVSEQMAARIDAARGSASRAQWVRQLIDAELSSGREPGTAASTAPVRSQRPARVPAKPASTATPEGDHAGHSVSPAWGTAKSGRYRCETCRAWVDGPAAVLPVRGERMPEMKLWTRKTQLPEHGPGRHRTQVALSGWRRRCSASRNHRAGDAGRAQPAKDELAETSGGTSADGEKAGRMKLAGDYEAVEIYAVGIVALSACAPKDMPLGDVSDAVNVQRPTGIRSSWVPDLGQKFRAGLPNPCPCEGEPDSRVHYLFRC